MYYCVTYWSHQDKIYSIDPGVELVRHTWVWGIRSWCSGIELSRWSVVSFAPESRKQTLVKIRASYVIMIVLETERFLLLAGGVQIFRDSLRLNFSPSYFIFISALLALLWSRSDTMERTFARRKQRGSATQSLLKVRPRGSSYREELSRWFYRTVQHSWNVKRRTFDTIDSTRKNSSEKKNEQN